MKSRLSWLSFLVLAGRIVGADIHDRSREMLAGDHVIRPTRAPAIRALVTWTSRRRAPTWRAQAAASLRLGSRSRPVIIADLEQPRLLTRSSLV